MAVGKAFGLGAGALSVLAAALAVAPVAHGNTQAADEAKSADPAPKIERRVERRVGRPDRKVRVAFAGGSYLGVTLREVDGAEVTRLKLPEEKGALVTHVEEGSPAQKAGLAKDDVIVRYHGEAVLGASQLSRLVSETPVGRTVPLEVVRGGASRRMSATLAERKGALDGGGGEWTFALPDMPEPPEPPAAPRPPDAPALPAMPRGWGDHRMFDRMVWFGGGPRKLGLEYQEISGQLAAYFKLSAEEGVLVTAVDDDGPAAKAGLKAGDVILKLGTREVSDGDDLRRAVEKLEPGRETTVTVSREGRSQELKLTPAGARRERERDGSEI